MATITKQQLFSTAMLAYLNELEGGFLKKFAETKTATGGESVTFNRLTESTASDGVASMLTGNTQANGGTMKEIKATIAYISAQDKIKEEDMNKTAIDIKAGFVRSLGNAVMRKEDSKILAAIKADTNVNKVVVGVASGTWADQAAIKKLIMHIRKCQALAEYTPDNYSGLALVMSPKGWSELSSSDYMINGDYLNAFGTAPNGKVNTFYGAEVVLVKDTTNVPDTEAVLIPSNSIVFAEWEGSMRADAEFFPTDGLTYHLQAVKSIGVGVAEPGAIYRLSATATAPAN